MRTLSTQYTIKEVSIVTKGGSVEVSSMFEELNIFDSLFLPIVSGNILMVDSIGLIGRFIFDGSEVIKISMTKDGDSEIGSFQKAFRIYKQSDRRNLTQTSEKYILHFVSDELIFSDQQRVNQSYVGPYSYIVDRILKDYLGVSNHALHDATTGIRSVVIPNLRPLEAIDWCAKRSVDQYSAPNYLFYSNLLGFNFASLSNLLNNPSIMDIKFEPKNLFDDSNQALRELSSARSFEVVVENDVIDRTRSGVNAGTFIGFDPMTRTFDSTPMNYNNIFKTMLHANENPNVTEIINRDGSSNLTTVESRKVLSIFGTARKYSQYIQRWDPESLTIIENYEDLIFQRKSILKNLTARRLKLVMPGNFQLTSGFNVFFTAPSFARREVGEYNEDKSISGKYIIIATRHIITMDRHETVIEVSTDSTRNDKQLVSSVEQNNEILQYGI
jgi:hypothetical protein